MSTKKISVTQTKSKIGRPKSHRACLSGLGIRRIHEVVKIDATTENLGMIRKIAYMLRVEEI